MLWLIGRSDVVTLVEVDGFRATTIDMCVGTPTPDIVVDLALEAWDASHAAAGGNVVAVRDRRKDTSGLLEHTREEWSCRVVDVVDFAMRGTPVFSPHKLVQEAYRALPWRLLVGCVLCNRARGDIGWSVSRRLFSDWPTPEAMAEADVRDVAEVVLPLGLQGGRAATIVAMSRAIVADQRVDVSHLPGVGEHAIASYRVFHLGDASFPTGDKRINAYLEWKVSLQPITP